MTQKNTKGAAVPTTTAPDNAGEGIKKIARHITETFVALLTTTIWFVAISSVSFDFLHMYFRRPRQAQRSRRGNRLREEARHVHPRAVLLSPMKNKANLRSDLLTRASS